MGVDNLSDFGVSGKRKSKRARVLLSAKIRVGGGEVPVRLRDLSRKGALIECNPLPAVGSEVVFVRGSTIVPARVAWTGAGRVGLEFLHMIEESEVLVHVGRPSANRSEQRFRRPRVLTEDLTDQERQLAKVWGVQVGIMVPGE